MGTHSSNLLEYHLRRRSPTCHVSRSIRQARSRERRGLHGPRFVPGARAVCGHCLACYPGRSRDEPGSSTGDDRHERAGVVIAETPQFAAESSVVLGAHRALSPGSVQQRTRILPGISAGQCRCRASEAGELTHCGCEDTAAENHGWRNSHGYPPRTSTKTRGKMMKVHRTRIGHCRDPGSS